MPVTLAPATPGDLDAVLRLERSGFAHGAWSRAAWADEVDGTDRHVVVARDGDAIVGVATFQAVPGGDVADLHRVVVDPDRRGERIGEALLRDGEAWAATAGAARVLLEVDTDNAPARALYDRLGYAPLARRDNYYGPGAHALVMGKELEHG